MMAPPRRKSRLASANPSHGTNSPILQFIARKSIVEKLLFWRETLRPIAWIGVLLVVLGIGALAVRSFSYTTTEKVLDVGPIHATADKEHDVYLYPAAGIAAILIGGALVVFGRRN